MPDCNLDSLTSPNPTYCAAERPFLEDGTIVTKETHDSDGFDSALEDADGEQFLEEDDDSDISSHASVPAEVKVSFHENDNDHSCHDNSDSDSEPSDAESDEELDPESEEEDNDDESVDHDSDDEYDTDEDSVESQRSEDGDLMDGSSCSTPSRTNSHDSPLSDASQHELFLPWDVSPCTQSLKYEEDDESSDEEEDVPHLLQRTYMIGNGRSGRPRMWDGCPSSISVSSNSSSSVGSCSSHDSKSSKSNEKAAKTGVSFSNSVTVYPVFETTVYPPSMVQSIFTKRDELRINKLRNKREFAYDLHDWRNATEEEEMEPNDMGELVHPVHCAEKSPPAPPCRTRNVVQTYSSALGGYTIGSMNSSGVVHRAKRMRMYYP